MPSTHSFADASAGDTEVRRADSLLLSAALKAALLSSVNLCSIATDAAGLIRIFNVGAERMLGYRADEVVDRVSLLDISDATEMLALALAVSTSVGIPFTAGFATLVCAAARAIEESVAMTLIRRDGGRVPTSLSITVLPGHAGEVLGYSIIATDDTARREAEEAKQRLADIVTSSDDAIIGKTLDGVITSWNAAAHRIFGYSAAEAIGHPMQMLIPAGRINEEPGILARIARGENVEHFETVRVRKDGLHIPISATISPVTDATGRVIGASKIARDVTNRRRAEALLRENDALAHVAATRLAQIVQSMNEACFEIDHSWHFTLVNSRSEALFCRRREAMLGHSLWTIFSELVGTPTEALFRRTMLERTPVSFEVLSSIAGGWLEIRLFPSGAGLAAFCLDIHQRKLAELALRESEASLSAAQARAHIGNWEIDGRTGSVIWSAEMFRIFGRDPDAGMPLLADIKDMVHADDRDKFLSNANRAQEIEFRLVRPDGSIRWTEVRGDTVFDAQGNVLRSIGTAQDVTDRAQVQSALRASEERYHSTLESILEACQLIGHDWTYLYLNEAAATHNRRPNKELLGQKMTEVWPNIEATGVFALLRRCMIERIPLHEEVQLVFPDGSTGWFDVRTQPVPEGIFVLSIDVTKRRDAEDALHEAGALQRAIFSCANFSCIATDTKGVIQIFNVGAERLMGYTAGEVVNQFTLEALHDPKELLERANALSAAFAVPIATDFEALTYKAAHGIEDVYELTKLRKDGSRLPAMVSASALRDSQGSIIGFLFIGADNTARKHAEDALAKAGALQSAIFNSANFSSIATDAKGVIQIFNVGAERMLGYAAGDVMNKITPADMSDAKELVARAEALSVEFDTSIAPGFEALVYKASRGIEDIYDITYVCADGSRLPAVVSVTALRDANEAVIGFLLIGTDNTARKQIEAERTKLDQRLRDQHFYTRSLIESNIDALMTTDPHGIIIDVNKQTEALTGCTRDELIGAPFRNYFTDTVRAEAGIRRVLNEGTVSNYELVARARNGQLTAVSYNATTFHDRNRRLQGVVVAARDVTELKRFEETLLRNNLELKEASRMKSEFLANMSHELRTPLNSIIGFSEVLADGLMGTLADQQRESIGNIFSSGNHLLSLINDILDLSKIEAGKMTLDWQPVHWKALFASSLSIVKEMAASRQIKLDWAAVGELATSEADARKVKQILYNLLSNAIKFTGTGGQVSLQAVVVARADVGLPSDSQIGLSHPLPDNEFTEFLQISVTDNGCGISAEGLERLFKPFSQIDGGLSRKFEGTGLGLAMVKLLTELHGGSVAVQSTVGEGSCFIAWLPIRAWQGTAKAEEALPAIPGSKRRSLIGDAGVALVVEDDYQAAELIRIQLELEGFEVVHAASADAALIVAAHQPLSLVTLDIMMMPDFDGWELLGRLKEIPALQRVPVVIISILADPDRGFSLGAAAVLQKPFSRKDLYEALVDASLLPRSKLQGLKVLVADDDPGAMELAAARVAGLASTVLRANGGREAIDIARAELPDLIILDLMMPDVNGFDVVDALNEHADTAKIPIIAVTAKDVSSEERAQRNRYKATVIEKTRFDPKIFAAEVRRAVTGRKTVG
jgi:PAS domain S-box-containing protein